MARSDTTQLAVASRTPSGSRDARRLRRRDLVPGVVYGGSDDPVAFEVDARVLRAALHHAGAVIEVAVDGGAGQAVILKDAQRHPVRGETVHVDLLRVRLDRPIQSTVVLELHGADDSPGIRDGGVLDQVTRELNVEALPAELPDLIVHDVSAMEMNETLLLSAISAPQGVTLLDDLEETVIATLVPPRLEVESSDEIEEETGVVGEDGEAAADEQAGDEDASDSSGDEG